MHTRKANTLEEIDAMFSILSNAFAFRRGSVWWKHPTLQLTALIAWLLPIAFTIPPASISVKVAEVMTSAVEPVPNFDFASFRYVAEMPMKFSAYYLYNGPSTEVQKVANTVKDNYAYFETGSVQTSFLVAVMPSLFDRFSDVADILCDRWEYGTKDQPLGPGNMTFLQCDLHNSSYHTGFNYESGRQSIAIQTDRMEIVSTMKRLSYTAIADAFFQIIKGSVTDDGNLLNVDTNIRSTVLVDTPELSFLSSQHARSRFESISTVQMDLWEMNNSSGQSLSSSPYTTNPHKSLQNVMEEMFQNITISLISSELLQPNITSEFAPPMTTVNTTTYRPMYQYSSRQLWIAYGVAIAASAVAALLGSLAIFFNDASYSNNFSSVYRTAYTSELGVVMQVEDMKATDPLPRYLAKAALYITNPNSTARPVPGDKQWMTVATRADSSSETLRQPGTETTESEDSETRVADHCDAGSYLRLDHLVDAVI
ncbi:hypothetical protein E0Z10_g8652 [Xylaria hypoxylon]|uniref:Uncharacterized protein n=1 Tax=Xylaria hypoxylon TaxID=37992 RepID=A0A4Z0YAR5_9PEZI|nr:hypothetical protein E0Z10_g8652 [Xylaria hypoxylon]